MTTLRLGKLLGIELRLDYSWFLIFLLLTWSLAGHYLMVNAGWSAGVRLVLALVTALLFFASVLAHEYGHSLVARRLGVGVERITLFIFGGMAHLKGEPKRARDEFLIAIAGPLVSLGLAAVFALLLQFARSQEVASLEAVAFWLRTINFALALFNLIPGFPLDGGRVLRAVLWAATGKLERATRTASRVGQGVAFVFVALGLWQLLGGSWVNGVWTAFIGWFLYRAATSQLEQLSLQELLRGVSVREVMLLDCPHLDPQLPVATLVEQVMGSGRRCFPVLSEQRLVGLVTLHQIKALAREQWAQTSVAEVMIPAEALLTSTPDEAVSSALERMVSADVNQLPVLKAGQFVGMATRESVLNYLRTRTELFPAGHQGVHG
jgi:Zn-dependent protease/CBS domain-containing protein